MAVVPDLDLECKRMDVLVAIEYNGLAHAYLIRLVQRDFEVDQVESFENEVAHETRSDFHRVPFHRMMHFRRLFVLRTYQFFQHESLE